MTRRKFSREFKIEAVKLVTERGVRVAQACRDLDLAESVLRRWMREATVAPATAFPGNGQQRPELAEIAALKKEVARLKAERDILKKGEPCAPLVQAQWRALTSRGKRHDVRVRCEASAYLAPSRQIWLCQIACRATVSWMCEVLGVSRSGFHAWLKRPISARASYDAKLVVEIDKSFKASDRTYGARRVWRDVLEDGLSCGLHRIERLMRQNAMRARPKRRGQPKDDGERSVIADNILDRDFQADRPNQKCPLGRLLRNRLPGDRWPTSPTSGPRRAGSTSRSCSTCSPGASPAGR